MMKITKIKLILLQHIRLHHVLLRFFSPKILSFHWLCVPTRKLALTFGGLGIKKRKSNLANKRCTHFWAGKEGADE